MRWRRIILEPNVSRQLRNNNKKYRYVFIQNYIQNTIYCHWHWLLYLAPIVPWTYRLAYQMHISLSAFHLFLWPSHSIRKSSTFDWPERPKIRVTINCWRKLIFEKCFVLFSFYFYFVCTLRLHMYFMCAFVYTKIKFLVVMLIF